MKDKWLTDLHDRMEGFEMDEPDGLWDSIEQNLKPATSHRPAFIQWKRLTAIAAVAALIVCSVVWTLRYTTDDASVIPAISSVGQPDPATSTRPSLTTPEVQVPIAEQPSAPVNRRPNNLTHNTSVTTDTAAPVNINTPTLPDSTRHTTQPKPTMQSGSESPHTRQYARHSQPAHGKRKRSTPDNRLSLALFASNGTNASLSDIHTDNIMTNCIVGSNNAQWNDSPILGMMLYNKGQNLTTEYHHRQPIRAGLSFTYRINSRLGVESGLAYANLTSDLKEGTEAHYYAGKQTLHYIGIPVNLKCTIWSWNGLDLYGSAGLMAEKCISGSLKKEYVLNRRSGATTTDRIAEKPFQLSVNASAGIQYNITPLIGLYAEPGASYYFNDGTSLSTIYKEKPLNFNLNLGLRFSFGN